MLPATPAPRHRSQLLRTEAVLAARFLLITAALLLIIWIAVNIYIVTISAFLAFVLASLLWPITKPLSRYLTRPIAAIIVVLTTGLLVAGLLWATIIQLINSAPTISTAAVGSVEATNKWLIKQGWVLPQNTVDNLQNQVASRADQLITSISGAAITSFNIATATASITALALAATVFTLIGAEQLSNALTHIAPPRYRTATRTALREATTTARWWAFASTMTGLVNGSLIGIGLQWLGVPLAIPLGLITLMLGYVPMIGSTIAGTICVAIALFFGGINLGLEALILVVIVIATESNLLSPLLMSRAVRFPPVITLLLSTTGAVALGMIGLFLAIPVIGIAVSAYKGFNRTVHDAGDTMPIAIPAIETHPPTTTHHP
ncbi:AI-2E family transporter [Dermatophilus congolensis]|uniref:Pheromone autoinducer 2 transporter n=1 Tax=Dermatophilus congolensis TaxID=1863 RepID=A0A239V8G9_9MICO|nr:AI-2E family transporter [Dermatophilus congolensis]MBO3130511.1 AI-2E family transporter [Dermatophilus congolensis]MBO3130859.1 AI-2E family transporter [Dermatophilus congolensis]MBO3134983.1 AI-2E family transporter [Dermatophilus congolensis]MBO3137222.1 AI-2E family transporter [Dermatophilus congolensis]MBO3139467.1 AI-2E family transporter [Dermatophilus congolensis]